MRPLLFFGLLLTGCGEPTCKPGKICTWYGTPGLSGLAPDGTPRTKASTFWVTDVNFHPTQGWPVIMDWNNHRIVTLDEDERTVTVSGIGGELGDGPPGDALKATWNHPTDVAWQSDDSMVLAAWHNSRVARFTPDLSQVSFIAGTGGRAFSGDGGPAVDAELDLPSSVRVDEDDNIYLSDMANQRIRRIAPDGTITTVAGVGVHGFNGDGDALEVAFASPALQRAEPAFKMDYHDRSLYLADTHNGRIRRFDLDSNTVHTVAGSGSTPFDSDNGTACTEGCGFAGDGGPATEAQLLTPSDVAVASDGTLYIADTDNSCVRKVDSDGMISTFAGVCGERGFEGDGGPAADALLDRPFGVAVDLDDAVYISDTYNSVIRKVIPE